MTSKTQYLQGLTLDDGYVVQPSGAIVLILDDGTLCDEHSGAPLELERIELMGHGRRWDGEALALTWPSGYTMAVPCRGIPGHKAQRINVCG
jgi:hypothetical protein